MLLWVSTFWTDDEEQKALEVLRENVPPQYNYKPLEMSTRVDSQLSLKAAFKEGRLPDVFQANAGSDVLRWVSKRAPDAREVCELDPLSRAFDWEGTYFPESLRPASCHGHLYALPVGIHRLNVLFYNRELFTLLARQALVHGEVLREPSALQSPEELLAELEQVGRLARELDLGSDFVPLAIGAENVWPLTVVGFENVLLGLGKDAYQTLWQGGLRTKDDQRKEELVRSLEDMVSYLRSLFELASLDVRVSWQDAVRKVGEGRALFTVTGDWGWAQLDETQAARVETTAFPGTSKSFVYTPDSFAVPRELKKSGFRARAFLDSVVADKQTLLDFSKVKHSIPPRRDFEQEELEPPTLRESYQQFKDCSGGSPDCELLLAVSGLSPPPGEDDCFDDIDALLTLAVTGSLPPPDPEAPPRECRDPLPTERGAAKDRLFDLLLGIAAHPFAEDCR